MLLSQFVSPSPSPSCVHKSILYVCVSICCCCSISRLCPTLWDPMDYSMPGFPVLHYLQEFAQVHVHWVGDAIWPSHPLPPSSPPALNLSNELEKTLESPLNSKKIKPVDPKGNQPWILFGRTDAEAEALILWPPDVKSQLIGKRLFGARALRTPLKHKHNSISQGLAAVSVTPTGVSSEL